MAGVSPIQAWNRVKDRQGLPSLAEWTRPNSAGNGVSYYQLWNRSGDWHPRTTVGNTNGQQGATGNTYSVMSPMNEAQNQAKLMDSARQSSLNSYVNGQRNLLNNDVGAAQQQVNQAMADRGIYNSTGAGTALANAFGRVASPYLQNISNAQSEYQNWRNNLGDQTAALYSQLSRNARDEYRTDRAYNTGVDQWNKQFGGDIYNTLYAGALGRGQVQQDFNGIDFPQIPSWMTAYLRYASPGQGYGPTGDPIEQGHGPIGDAGETQGSKPGFVNYKLKSYARERASVDDAYRNSALALQQAQEDRIAKAQKWQQDFAERELAQKKTTADTGNEDAFKQAFISAAWKDYGKGTATPLAAMEAFASSHGKSVMDYVNLLTPWQRDELRKKSGSSAAEPDYSKYVTPWDNNGLPEVKPNWQRLVEGAKTGYDWSPAGLIGKGWSSLFDWLKSSS